MKTRFLLVASVACLPAVLQGGSTLSEPATVFYGKVLNQSGVLEHVLTEGELVWTLDAGEDEPGITLKSTLADYGSGEYSYRLDVPHHVLALGLDTQEESVPLSAGEAPHRHLAIRVNGLPATIKVPGNHEFQISAARRAATHRLDLLVSLPSEDSDGDGMPDWWEDEQGLDKQSNDANGDLDGDGLSNFDEYLRGSSATHDNRGPELLTSELFAYSGAVTGVPLQTFDLDSNPDEVVYTLTNVPGAGDLILRNAEEDPSDPDRELEQGDVFSQADVNSGRVVFRINDEAAEPPVTSFAVSVRDEDSNHEADSGQIEVRIFVPSEGALTEQIVAEAPLAPPLPNVDPGERIQLRNAALGREHGFVVWDLSGYGGSFQVAQPTSSIDPEIYLEEYVPKFGQDVRQVIVGSRGADELAGGMMADNLAGGEGDDRLQGGGGPDRFIMEGAGAGHDTLEDFELGPQGDVLDIAQLLEGPSSLLNDYVELRDSERGALLGVDVDGDGSGFTDVTVTFSGLRLTRHDLYELVENGNLSTGSRVLSPLVEIASTIPEARENGPEAGAFTIRRAGALTTELRVNFLVAGTASNGIDFSRIASSISLPAGQKTVTVPVTPFADTQNEVPEVVELTLLEGTGYTVGSELSAQVIIQDLKPEINVTSLTPMADLASGQEGRFMISRSEVLDRSVLVRLTTGGSAAAGTDFAQLPSFIELAAGESFHIVRVTPLPSAVLEAGAETVTLSISDDPSYLSVTPRDARISLVAESSDLFSWRERHFADNGQDLSEFAMGDTGEQGVPHLLRYGFSLDPTNPLRDLAGARPSVWWEDGGLMLRYRENPAASDLSYQIEASQGLDRWRPIETSELEEVTPLDAAAGIRVWRSANADDSEPAFRFLRVRVVRETP